MSSDPSPLERLSQFTREQLMELQREKAHRSLEALKLYIPNEYQKAVHDCTAKEILIIGGNRSGKSLCAFTELAWAATGTHPLPDKYPKENLTIAIVGDGWRHIGLTVYPALFRAGAFSMIRDKETGLWRAYHPVLDADRKEERKPAPPLIPPRLIKNQSWVLKAASYIQTCDLTNGTRMFFFSSEGEPPQGWAADLILFDEDLSSEAWLPEMQARLADKQGRFIWSAMPHSKCDSLLGLSERADAAAAAGRDHIKKFTFRFLDNPYIQEEEKKRMLERWAALGEDVVRQRAEGEFVMGSLLVYPSYNLGIHGMDRKELPDLTVPADWCRFAAIDPGHAVTAVLFAAIPPSGDFCLLYDELYIRNCNALIFGDRFKEKVEGQEFYAFLIDSHGARLTDIGSGRSAQDQYTERLATLNVASRTSGHSFVPGCDDIQAGLSSVRSALHVRPSGSPFLRVLRGACPNLDRELKRYKKKAVNVGGQTIVTDEPNKRGEFHLVDCLRYLMAYEPRYHKPVVSVEKPWWSDWAARRQKEKNKGGVVYLAPNSYSSEIYYA